MNVGQSISVTVELRCQILIDLRIKVKVLIAVQAPVCTRCRRLVATLPRALPDCIPPNQYVVRCLRQRPHVKHARRVSNTQQQPFF
jgi:molybdenum cofactor biosynthesis enzyme MoaA